MRDDGHGNLCPVCGGVGYEDKQDILGQSYREDCDTCTNGQIWDQVTLEDALREDADIKAYMWYSSAYRAPREFYRWVRTCSRCSPAPA